MKRFNQRITIRHVSGKAGVSIGTVSNVLNAPHKVAKETRDLVMSAIEETGYRPNRAARSLQARRTYLIGYRLPTPKSGISQALDVFLHELVEEAGGHGLEVVLFTAGHDDEVDTYREVSRRGDVDGFVLSETNYDDPRIDYLVEAGIPFVSFGRSRDSHLFNWVDVDGGAGIETAVEHLFQLGHRRIAMVAWPEGSESGDDRYLGYRRAVERLELDYDERLVVRTESGIEGGRTAWRQLREAPAQPTAVVCVEDLIALGVAIEAQHDGLVVGADVSITGFDDLPACEYFTPRLTSISQPMGEVGRILIDLLVGQIHDPTVSPNSALLKPTLVRRESTGMNRS